MFGEQKKVEKRTEPHQVPESGTVPWPNSVLSTARVTSVLIHISKNQAMDTNREIMSKITQ